MRAHVVVLILAIAVAAPAGASQFLSIPPLLAPASRASHVYPTSVSCWLGGILVAGRRWPSPGPADRASGPEHWIAEVQGMTVRELDWPPAYLDIPEVYSLRTCGAVGARAAVVVEGRSDERHVSRALLWDGRDWVMFPKVAGIITSVVELDGRIIIGGAFPAHSMTSLHVMFLRDCEWLPFDGGLPLPSASVEILPWNDTLVAVGRPWAHSVDLGACLWQWRHGAWKPLSPNLEMDAYRWTRAMVWNDRLVVGWHSIAFCGVESAGFIMLAADGTVVESPAANGLTRPRNWNATAVGVWDGRLLLAPLDDWKLTGLLVLEGAALKPHPHMPRGHRPFGAWDHVSTRGRDAAVLSLGDFEGPTVPREPVHGRRQLACWHDGSWWVPSLAVLEE